MVEIRMTPNTNNNTPSEFSRKFNLGLNGFIMLKPGLIAWLEENEIEYEELYTSSSSFCIYIPDDAHRLMANLRWIE